VFFGPGDDGVERIDTFTLNLHLPDRDVALARVRQELPADATVAWDQELGQCYLAEFTGPTLETVAHAKVKVELLKRESGTLAPHPREFNQAVVDLVPVDLPPSPGLGC
jgi:hypothetical protein